MTMESNAIDAKATHPVDEYRPPESFYDEFLDANRQPRPHWQAFAKSLRNFDREDLTQREDQLKRIIRDQGITYNIYSEPASESRPWTMDMLPVVIGEEEWSGLGEALGQRAELLNLIYKDLYGEQTLLKEGILPHYLVLANPHFSRPCYGIGKHQKRPIHFYAADLARSPDGNWWVLSDRLEACSGLGYSLENRFLSSRIFPGMMRQLGVKPLNHFIADLCQSYEEMAPQHKDNPRIALLTPGPANETYFEQSFLARHLGYTLVEGADLTVREGRVLLKTISGVREVDVIIRRVDSSWCDPLELRNDSMLGVPGLVDVMRNGQVAVANALGAGVLESSAIPAFLPGICEHFLKEPLKIPSAATWWCGQKKELDYVLANLEQLVLKPTFRVASGQGVFGPNLGKASLERWRRRIQANPEAFSAQEMVSQATTPVYEHNRFIARHFLLRAFLSPTEAGWQIMPGGLARIASGTDPVNVSMQKGGESKDLWILASPNSARQAAHKSVNVHVPPVRRVGMDLPSRVADNFFWLGRYVERTEGLVRMLKNVLESLLEQDSEFDVSTQSTLQYFFDEKKMQKLVQGDPPKLNQALAEKWLGMEIRDRRSFSSLVSNLSSLNATGTTVKERLSTQTLQQLLRLNDLIPAVSTQRPVLGDESFYLLDDTLSLLAGFSGLVMENMTRGQNWFFLDLGRRIERCHVILNLIDSTVGEKRAMEDASLRKLLLCGESSMTYRRRYLTHLNIETVLDLLILEDTNPRSLTFQLKRILENLNAMPHSQNPGAPTAIDEIALSLARRLESADMSALAKADETGARKPLGSFIADMYSDLYELTVKIEQQYFAHTLGKNKTNQTPSQN